MTVDRSPGRLAATVRLTAVAAFAVGVLCQFAQGTDPTFPLLYFTVCSAVLTVVVLGLAAVRPEAIVLDRWRGAVTVAVVLSGLIFATVLAPVNNGGPWFAPHDDVWIRTANVLLHGVGPVLAVADFFLHPFRTRAGPWRLALGWCLWPAAWALVALPLDLTGLAETPYLFLQVRNAGDVPVVLGAVVGLFAVVSGLGAALVAVRRRIGRGR